MNMHEVISQSIRIFGASEHAITGFRPSIEMLVRNRDVFPWDKFFSHRFTIDQYEEAMLTSMKEESMKVLLSPW